MIDVKLGRELEAKATEGPWEVTYGGESPAGHGPTFEFAYVDTTEGKRLTQDLRHEDAEFIEYMRNNAKDFFEAAELVEAWKSMRADGWEIAKTIQRAQAAERRVAELEAEQKQTLAGFLSASEALIDERENEREARIAAERARDEALKEAHALRDLQAIVNRDGGHGSLADAIARVYADRTEHDELRAQLAEATRRAEVAEKALAPMVIESAKRCGEDDIGALLRAGVDGDEAVALSRHLRTRAAVDPKGGG